MNHLTEEQFESIMQGQSQPQHLYKCRHCMDQLSARQAMRQRLHRAFLPIHADDGLAEKVRRRTRVHLQSGSKTGIRHPMSASWRYWMTAAAAILFIFLLILPFTSSSAMAASELAQIHQWNLDSGHMFFSESDPVRLTNYFKKNLGFNPLFPKNGQGLALRGCCVQHFRGRQTGSYVVDTPDGIMSIIVVPDTLRQLGMKDVFEMNGYPFGKSAFAANNMVSVRIGHFTYCAVGEISHEYLTSVLVQLLADIDN